MSDSAERRSPPAFVTTADGLAELARRLAAEPLVALDTEANSLHAFRERVCVVQLSVPGLDAIVDPLTVPDLSPLKEVVASDAVEVVMHGGDYDVSLLSRDHGFSFGRVFDTMIAATLLSEPKVGLQALVEANFGVRLSKKHQTADWSRRPLSPDRIEYLRSDTAYLLPLRERLAARLVEADLVAEAAIEFRRLASRRGAPPPLEDPEAWRRAKGTDRLSDLGRAVLAAAWRWREDTARAHDVPRFRVLADETLVSLATSPPANEAALASRPGAGHVVRMGDAPALLSAILEGVEAARRGAAPPPSERPRRTPEEAALLARSKFREERLRRWRTQEAQRRGVPNVVVLPNPALLTIALSPPADAAALAALPDVGPKRAERYGATILALLAPPGS